MDMQVRTVPDALSFLHYGVGISCRPEKNSGQVPVQCGLQPSVPLSGGCKGPYGLRAGRSRTTRYLVAALTALWVVGAQASPPNISRIDSQRDLMGPILRGATAVPVSRSQRNVNFGPREAGQIDSIRRTDTLAPIHKMLGHEPVSTGQPPAADPADRVLLPAVVGKASPPAMQTPGSACSTPPVPQGYRALPFDIQSLVGALGTESDSRSPHRTPRIKAKALLCLDCSTNKVVLAQNVDEPLPIASITKLLTAMLVVTRMDPGTVVEVPQDIVQVPRHRVGLKPGDHITVKDLLHGLLIESGNDCAELLARAYSPGGKDGFVGALNALASRLGARNTTMRTPSGLDVKIITGRKDSQEFTARRSNVASARDVALIAQKAFQYPTISGISTLRSYTFKTLNPKPRTYSLRTNDRLLGTRLPVSGAKTGYTDAAGRCIVARFQNETVNYMVVVLNTSHHFSAAEKIYRWASSM